MLVQRESVSVSARIIWARVCTFHWTTSSMIVAAAIQPSFFFRYVYLSLPLTLVAVARRRRRWPLTPQLLLLHQQQLLPVY